MVDIMKARVTRSTVDLSAYPDLVVIYLGMRVNALTGFKTLLGFIPPVGKAVRQQPEGLLHNDFWFYSPRHIGIRQYWRDFESLEAWSRSAPHRDWWQAFLRDSGCTGFYHELYFMRGGMEGMYVDMEAPVGFMHFAPIQPARGSMFSARRRLRLEGESREAAPVTEEEFYGPEEARAK